MLQGTTGISSQTNFPTTQIVPSKYSSIIGKVNYGQQISNDEIQLVLNDLRETNTNLAARNISDVLITIIDPASPSRPNKNANVEEVLSGLRSPYICKKFVIDANSYPKISHYLSVKDLEQTTALSIHYFQKNCNLPNEVDRQAKEDVKKYKNNLQTELAKKEHVRQFSALESQQAHKISNFIEAFNKYDAPIKTNIDKLVDKLAVAKNIEHHNLAYMLVKQTNFNPPEQSLIYMANGLPYDAQYKDKQDGLLKALKVVLVKNRKAPQEVIDVLKRFGVIKLENPKNTEELKQKPQAIVEKTHISNPMLDKNYWYSETDIQYIANGLITDYNVTPALGASENRSLKQLLEGALEEYKKDYDPTFIPLNIRGNHWIALSVFKHQGNEYAFYKDSLGPTQYKAEREQVEQLIKEYNPDIIFKYHTGQEQQDGSSCGIFALQNMKIMSDKLVDINKFIEDFTGEAFASQLQADQLRQDFSQLYQQQLQYNDRAREAIRENHYPELQQIRDIIGDSQYSIRALARSESLDSTVESNTLGIDIALPKQINKGIYQYNYIITATNDCNPDEILDLLAQKLNIDKTQLVQSEDNGRTIIIDKSLLEDSITSCDKLSIEAIKQKIQLQENQPVARELIQQDQGKSIEDILQEILKENNISKIQLIHTHIQTSYEDLSNIKKLEQQDSSISPQGTNIESWTPKQILDWSKCWKNAEVKNKPSKEELLAVTKQAVRIHNGYTPRDVQLLSSLLLINKNEQLGRLLQVKTGEGKTVISAITATFFALTKQKPIDIITSSSVLAERDAKAQEAFFSLFGLSCRNVTRGDSSGMKNCYNADILYGYAGDFEGDYLRDSFKGLNTRIGREFAYAIVDEVDSMLLDEGAKITKLSSPRPGVEYLAPIFLLTWQSISEVDVTEEALENKEYYKFLCDKVEEKISSIIDGGHFSFPNYLLDYIRSQIPDWSKSALKSLVMQENKHYVVATDEDTQEQVIAPVDYINSGVIQSKTNWDKGVHQFLQAKHSLKMQPEGLMTSFISNLSFFSMYDKNIMGMTGTLGSKESRDLLSSQYSLDSIIIPKYKQDLFKQEESIITENTETHKQAIADDAINVAKNGRVALIICPDIQFSKDCAESIIQTGYASNKVNLYSRNDSDEASIIDKIQTSGQIIVATNLAGRGTDIRLTEEVNKAGGLHVILTSLPHNLRVEEQAFGRTARQGNNGSGRLIINGAELAKMFGVEYKESDSVSFFKRLRDLTEQQRIGEVKDKRLKEVLFSDKLFGKFNKEIYQPLKSHNNNRFLLEQLEENWGFWLKQQEKRLKTDTGRQEILVEYERFKPQQIEQYKSGRATNNPIYQIQLAHSVLGKDDKYDESIMLLEKIISSDDPYHFAGHYYLAYAYLRKNFGGKGKNVPELSNGAHRHLSIAKVYLEEVIIAQLQAMQLVLGTRSTGTPLAAQISNKIELLNHQLNYINNALEFIESNNDGKKILTAGSESKTFDQLYPPENAPKSEIRELNRLGSLNLYTIDAKKPPQDIAASVLVTVIGAGQVIFGAMLAIATAGQRGVGMIIGGLNDIYTGANAVLKGEGIDLGNYFKQKAIEIGIDLISDRIADKFSSISKAETARKLTTTQVLKEVGTRVGTRIAADQLIKYTVNELTKHTLKKAIGGEIKDAAKTIKTRLSRPETLQALENIYAIDNFYQGRYGRELSNRISEFLNKRSNELQTIATAVITSSLTKAVGKTGNTAGAVVVNTASKGVEVAIALDKIKELADDFCDFIEPIILQTEQSLPENKDILKRLVPSINDEQAIAVEKYLQDSSIIKGKWDINESLLGFREGIEQLTEVQEYKKEPEIFKFEDIENILHSKDKNTIQEKETLTLDEIKLEKIGLALKTSQIQKAIKQMHSTFAKRGQFAEPVIDSYCDAIGSRMRGQIRSSVVAPMVSTIFNPIFESIEQEIVSNVLYSDKLEKQFLLENYRRAGLIPHEITGVSAGDEVDTKNQNQDKEEKRKTIDLSPDTVFLNKLTSLFEMDQDSEVARMLKSLRESQEKPKTVPIYDSSNKTHLIPKIGTGFSLVNTANANPTNAIATTISSELPLLEFSLFTGSAISSGSINVSRLMGETISMARAFPQAALITGGIVGTGMALNQASQFEAQHPWITADSTETLLDPWTTPEDANAQWQQMRNDPILGITNTGNNATINMPIMQTGISSLLNDIRMDIDPNANKPSIESFPAVYKPKSILFTPDDRNILADFGKLEGFMPSNYTQPMVESFPITEIEYENLISLKEGDHSIKSRLKDQQLPTEGKIRFVPDERYNPNIPLQKGINHGYYDRFGNEWTKGPSRTEGEPFEWDVQLSETGKAQLGHLSRDGKHINVSLKGRITHK